MEHLLFLAGGLIGWWPVLSPLEELPRLPYAGQLLYLFLQGIPATVLGALFVFAPNPLYSIYNTAPRISDLSALDDQQVSGLIMGSIGALVYLGALSLVFFRWLAQEE